MKQWIVNLAMACGAAFLVLHAAKAAQTGSVVAWGNQVLPFVQPGPRDQAGTGDTAHGWAPPPSFLEAGGL